MLFTNAEHNTQLEQILENKENIEILQKYIKQIFYTKNNIATDPDPININRKETDVPAGVMDGFIVDGVANVFKIIGASTVGAEDYLSVTFVCKLPKGAQGIQGEKGDQGVRGKSLNNTGDFDISKGKNYTNSETLQDLATYHNSVYICIKSYTFIGGGLSPDEDTEHWELFVGAPRELNFTGDWVELNEYLPYDVAIYSGSSYVCVKAVTGVSITPPNDTTHWELLASAGESGAPKLIYTENFNGKVVEQKTVSNKWYNRQYDLPGVYVGDTTLKGKVLLCKFYVKFNAPGHTKDTVISFTCAQGAYVTTGSGNVSQYISGNATDAAGVQLHVVFNLSYKFGHLYLAGYSQGGISITLNKFEIYEI